MALADSLGHDWLRQTGLHAPGSLWKNGPDQLLGSWDPNNHLAGFFFSFLFLPPPPSGRVIYVPLLNNLKEVSSSSSSSPSATSVITLICSKNIHMADSLRDGAIFELTEEGSACLCARLFPLRQAAKNCVHSRFFFFVFFFSIPGCLFRRARGET